MHAHVGAGGGQPKKLFTPENSAGAINCAGRHGIFTKIAAMFLRLLEGLRLCNRRGFDRDGFLVRRDNLCATAKAEGG